MTTKLEKALLAHICEANRNWEMFNDSDRVLIGISGGKDSLALLTLMSRYDLDLHALHVQLKPGEPMPFLDYCKKISTVHVIETHIHDRAFAPDARKKPCFICMRQRRKAVVSFAVQHGFDSVFYGHHKNDVVETFLLNQIYGREISTMLPKQVLFEDQFHICRPLYLIPEPFLKTYAKEQNLPAVPETCPASDHTRRKHMKELLNQLQEINPKIDVIDNIFSSMKRINRPFIPVFPDTNELTDVQKPRHKKHS